MIDRYTWPGCLPGYVPMGPPDEGSLEPADEKPAALAPRKAPQFAAQLPGEDEVGD